MKRDTIRVLQKNWINYISLSFCWILCNRVIKSMFQSTCEWFFFLFHFILWKYFIMFCWAQRKCWAKWINFVFDSMEIEILTIFMGNGCLCWKAIEIILIESWTIGIYETSQNSPHWMLARLIAYWCYVWKKKSFFYFFEILLTFA